MYLATHAATRLTVPVHGLDWLDGALTGLGQAGPTRGERAVEISSVAASAVTPKIASVLATKGVFGVTQTAHMIPIVGSIAAGVIMGITAWMHRKGPKQKVATTKIVEEIEPKMRENLQAYLAGPRTRSAQQVHVAAFDDMWDWLESNCGQPEMGKPGQNCINERKRGGVAPWCPSPDQRGCDFFTLYRDPIEFDAGVKEDPALTDILVGGAPLTLSGEGGGISLLPIALVAALALAVAAA